MGQGTRCDGPAGESVGQGPLAMASRGRVARLLAIKASERQRPSVVATGRAADACQAAQALVIRPAAPQENTLEPGTDANPGDGGGTAS